MALVDSTQQLLEAAMRGSWERQTALTNNIANADTPGYQPQDVNFESALQGAMHERRIAEPDAVPDVSPVRPKQGPNGAGVSVDQEAAQPR